MIVIMNKLKENVCNTRICIIVNVTILSKFQKKMYENIFIQIKMLVTQQSIQNKVKPSLNPTHIHFRT